MFMIKAETLEKRTPCFIAIDKIRVVYDAFGYLAKEYYEVVIEGGHSYLVKRYVLEQHVYLYEV